MEDIKLHTASETIINEIPVSMYELPGQKIDEHSIRRYIKDKEQDAAIKEAANSYTPKDKDIPKDYPRDEALTLVKEGLSSGLLEKQIEAIRMICIAPKDSRLALINQALEIDNMLVKKEAVKMIDSLPSKEITNLMRVIYERFDSELQRIAISRVYSLSQSDALEMIELFLESSNVEVKKAALGCIISIPPKDRERLISTALNDSDIELQKKAAKLIGWVPDSKKEEFFDLVVTKELGDELVKSSLYENKEISQQKFSRTPFYKTGSETTLVGGSLNGESIIRHINPQAFLAWQKCFEDYKAWQDNGFDYVPIEPIQSYRLNKEGVVDVFSGVLEVSLGNWLFRTDKFKNELAVQKNKLIKVLEQLGVSHKQLHTDNFCLKFFRDPLGKVDFTQVPRMYLIDFDAAVTY